MSRRALIVLVAILAWPAGVPAQNEPFLGTWELNLAKSAITRGAPPKIETVVNTPESDGFRSLLSVVSATSTSIEVHHYNFDGDFHQTEGGDPRELSFKRLDPHTIEQLTRRSGQVTVNRRIEVSKDGKTMTFIANGTTGAGQKYVNDTRVYEKR